MWLILADDLTGAADCAIAFARRGVAAMVGWDSAESACSVFAYDADSRALTAEATILRHRQALARLAGRQVFVKIDSTLRGQPAAAIAAALHRPTAHRSAIGVLAPAFPATGRTTLGGRVIVNGIPLEQTETWRRDRSYMSADLVDMLATAGLVGHQVPLAAVRSHALPAALRAIPPGDLAVCDALDRSDLSRLVRAAPDNACFIGSAGLAHALADTLPEGSARMPDLRSNAGALIVVGSLASVSRDAARELARREGVHRLVIRPGGVPPGLATAVAAPLRRGVDVLLELEMPDSEPALISPHAVAALAEALAPAAASASALVATGGETAAALLRSLGIHGIRLYEELEPGVSLGVTAGALEVPLATKAGAFGDPGTLVRIVERLRQSRQQETGG